MNKYIEAIIRIKNGCEMIDNAERCTECPFYKNELCFGGDSVFDMADENKLEKYFNLVDEVERDLEDMYEWFQNVDTTDMEYFDSDRPQEMYKQFKENGINSFYSLETLAANT